MSAKINNLRGLLFATSLNSAPGPTDLFLNESRTGFVLSGKIVTIQSSKKSSLHLEDTLGLS